MDRVKFYSSSDMSINFYGERIGEVIKSSRIMGEIGLLDALELFNVIKFLENGIYPMGLTDEQALKVKAKFNKLVAVFFNSQTQEDILDALQYFYGDLMDETDCLEDSALDKYSRTQMRESYFECFEKYKLNLKIDEEKLKQSINKWQIPIWYFLETPFFSQSFPDLIKELFLKDEKNIELLIRNYTINNSQYFVPRNIRKEELYRICEKYIDSEDVNLNYIRLISSGIKGIENFMDIDAKLKLKAKRKSEQLEKEYFTNKVTNSGIEQRIVVYTDEEEYNNAEDKDLKNLIDVQYINNNSSPESLLNYLMYLDYYFTGNWILGLCSYPNLEVSTFISVLGAKTQNYYENGFYFSSKNSLMLLSFKVFQEKLNRNLNIRIEDLITYFFEKYCKENFNISWLPVSFTNKEEKINIQTKNLFIIEEQLRKQWYMLVKDNEIDKELFELESTPKLKELRSFLNKKYVYIDKESKDITKVMFLLFSDQSHLGYINEKVNATTFVELIRMKTVYYELFRDSQKQDIDFLINNNIFSVDSKGYVVMNNKQNIRLNILENLYNYGVIHYYHTFKKWSFEKSLKIYQEEINEMVQEGLLRYENTFFAKPEVDFINYLLNNSEFDNALGLRNKYLHGSIIEDNAQDYLYALIILVTYVIKINEELILK